MDALQTPASIYEDDEDDNLNFNYGTSQENLLSASKLYNNKVSRSNSINSSRSRDLSFHEGHGDAPSCLKRGSFVTRVWIMASVSLGAGAFDQPKVVARVGYLKGVFIIVFFGIITIAQILLLLVLNAKERRVDEGNPNIHNMPLLMNTVGGTGSSDDPKYASYSKL